MLDLLQDGSVLLDLISIILLILIFVTALGIVLTRDLFSAVMLSGIFSLLMAATFFLLDAADVALTEAAVGAGITTVLFLGTLALTTDREKASRSRSVVPILIAGVTAALLLYTTFDNPRVGDADAPIHQHVAPRYISESPEEVGVANIVAAVLASYRGYDTLGEVAVVFTAGIGVLLMLGTRRRRKDAERPTVPRAALEGLRHHIVPRVVSKIVVPLVMLFALYVQFHGDYGPGGGFQAGALFAAAIYLFALVHGDDLSRQVIPSRIIKLLMASGVLLYTLVGFFGIFMGGNFLDYSVLASDPIAGQHLGILLIEFGVGMTVSGVLVAIFHAFAGRRHG